ncbi:MAG: tyrosine-type recombinase/integrase [Clostridia bacterium]|nr:tyrosine-type recombinase/integrase [Clostridia bacterium]
MIESLDDDPMRIPVILTAYYGLRRSEVLGIKWDAIDYKDKKIYIRHKIIEVKTLNGKVLEGMDVMKTKSSYRTLPLIPYIEGVLKAEAERQEELRKVMRGAYNKAYSEYVCVDAMGNLLKPQYITEHFKVILKQNGLRPIRFHDLRHSTAV